MSLRSDPERMREYKKLWARRKRARMTEPELQKLRAHRKAKRHNLLQWFIDLKQELSCELCGESRWFVLDFHHKDDERRRGKTLTVSGMVRARYAKKTILAEIDKCMVVCSNCHRAIHHGTYKI